MTSAICSAERPNSFSRSTAGPEWPYTSLTPMRVTGVGQCSESAVADCFAETADDVVLFNRDDTAGLLCGSNNKLFIERLDGMDIDDFNADAFCLQCIGSLNGFLYHETGRNNGDVRALAQRDALAQFELVIVVVVDAFHSQTAEADIARALVLNSSA